MKNLELVGVATALLYIVFFSWNPPSALVSILSSPIGGAVIFGSAIYLTLYKSRAVGILVLVGLIVSMARVTEHLTVSEKSDLDKQMVDLEAKITDARGKPEGPAKTAELNLLMAEKSRLQTRLNEPVTGAASSTTSGAASAGTSTGTTSTPPVSSPAAQTAANAPRPQSTSATGSAPPDLESSRGRDFKPIASCNLESFSAF